MIVKRTGAGPAGYVASIKAAQLGLKTACVEGRGTLGGTCLNVGCIPSKSLLHNSHLYHMARTEFKKRGIEVSGLSVNISQMIKAKDQSVSALAMGISSLFKKNKIDEERVVSSTGALTLKNIPEKMVVLGGGVIGLELGSLWNRLGTKVTVIEFLDAIGGPAMDSSISKSFASILKKQGLTIKTGTKAVGFNKSSDGSITVETEVVASKGKSEEVGDTLLIAVGRKPYTKHLGLENVGIEPNKRGQIDVDESFTTCVSSIKAIGDVIRGPMLAHKAEEEGIAVIEYITEGHAEVNYDAIPSVIYTHPEVAWVGKTEDQVKDSKIEYKVGTFPFVANARAKTIDEPEGLVKVISQKSDDKMLGVHLIGPAAGELINEAVLALGYGASSEDIARTCHAHPTFSEALKEACMATCGKAIHF